MYYWPSIQNKLKLKYHLITNKWCWDNYLSGTYRNISDNMPRMMWHQGITNIQQQLAQSTRILVGAAGGYTTRNVLKGGKWGVRDTNTEVQNHLPNQRYCKRKHLLLEDSCLYMWSPRLSYWQVWVTTGLGNGSKMVGHTHWCWWGNGWNRTCWAQFAKQRCIRCEGRRDVCQLRDLVMDLTRWGGSGTEGRLKEGIGKVVSLGGTMEKVVKAVGFEMVGRI